jgi:hypothetical protein
MESVMPYVLAVVPTIGVATLFYFLIKTILEGDRRERLAQAKWEAEHDRRERAQRLDRTGEGISDISSDASHDVNGPRAGEGSGTDRVDH